MATLRSGILLSWTVTAVHTISKVQTNERLLERKTRIDKQKRITKTTSKLNGSEYFFERTGNHCKCLLLSIFDSYAYTYNKSTHAKPPVLVNGQSSIFARELRKYSQYLKAFAGRVPCNNWTWGLQRKWHFSFGKFRNFCELATKKATTFCRNVFACDSNYSQYREGKEK